MKRREFIKAFAGAVATVAVGMRVAQAMPKLEHVVYRTSTINWEPYRGIYGAIARDQVMAEALAHSVMKTKEQMAANVLGRAFESSGEGARR